MTAEKKEEKLERKLEKITKRMSKANAKEEEWRNLPFYKKTIRIALTWLVFSFYFYVSFEMSGIRSITTMSGSYNLLIIVICVVGPLICLICVKISIYLDRRIDFKTYNKIIFKLESLKASNKNY